MKMGFHSRWEQDIERYEPHRGFLKGIDNLGKMGELFCESKHYQSLLSRSLSLSLSVSFFGLISLSACYQIILNY